MSKSHQNDPDEMTRLFVELTEDLAFARTYYPKRSVRVYLNSLAQRVFHDLYKKKRTPLRKFLTFWTEDLPLEMYRSRHVLLTSFVIFVLGMLIGIVSTIDNENFLGSVIGYDYVVMAEKNIANGRPMSVYGGDSEELTFVMIAMNNMRVMMITFVLGIFFSIGSGIYLFFNSIMVGAFQWFYVVRNLTLASFLTIWIHGAFEIPAIILSAAAGITMGNGLLFPGTLTRAQSLIISAKRGVKMMIGIIPFILLAAFIEGYATRHTVVSTVGDPIPTEWPTGLKWLFILTCFAIVIFYFVIYPMMVAKKHNFTGKVVESPQFKDKHDISFSRIKSTGEIFSDTFSSYSRAFGLFIKLFFISLPLIGFLSYYIFEKIPFYYYRLNEEYVPAPAGGRIAKVWDNIELIFQWNDYFMWDLFIIQIAIFTITGFNMIFSFRVKIKKDLNPTGKDYFKLLIKAFVPLSLAFGLMGIISTHVNFGVMLLIGGLSPFIMTWFIPSLVSKEPFGKTLKLGFTKCWKSYGNGIGLFFAITGTLVFIFSFVSLPLDYIKDMPINWFVLPLADNPQYAFALIDTIINMTLSHLLFPLYLLAFIFHYFSILEKEDAVGMFEKLKSFGTKSKVYEAYDEGTF